MPTDSECRKALTAIRELYVEIHDLDLDAYLLGKLFEVRIYVQVTNMHQINSLHIHDLDLAA